MSDRKLNQAEQMAALLIDLEAALRKTGQWQSTAPSAEALTSTQPFCVDTLDFCQWLQFIFIPRIQFMLEQKIDLPAVSGIAAMAEEVYKADGHILNSVVPTLNNIDQCLGGDSSVSIPKTRQ
ncbi:YqcC family protein [uncultured Pseudoteredinibacter sp.]|uniref:YqcC family protein n=1 Tax=uncultured Pseudoteredinibacter sp. TaxID=1641701 RepID=UPI0026370B4F|nr:YqcC family protein [uncultured Pseudoteredinibacter sp.]